MSDKVRLSDVLAAAGAGALTFGHVFAAQVVLVTAGKLRAKKGGVVTTEQISIDATGKISLSRPEPSDEPTSTRTLRDLLESLLQLSTSSTPRLRLCACRMESTGLDLLEAELDGAINNVDDEKRNADVGAVARATRDAIDRGAIDGGAPPSVAADESERASIVPDAVLLNRVRKLEEERTKALADAQKWASTAADAERASSVSIESIEQLRQELRDTKARLATIESNAEAHIAKAAAERDAAVAALHRDGDRRIESAVGDREARIATMQEEHAARVASLAAERDLRVTEVAAARAERDRKVAEAQSLVAERDRKLVEIERIVAERDRLLGEANTAHADALARLREKSESKGGEEERIQALEKALRSARDDHALALAAVTRERERLVDEATKSARAERDARIATLEAEGAKKLAELTTRHTQATKEAERVAAMRLAEAEAERTQRVAEAEKRAAEAMSRLESVESVANERIKRAIDETLAAKASAIAALEKSHAATLSETRSTLEASLREVTAARDSAIENTEKSIAEIKRERDYMVAREIKAREAAIAEEVKTRDSALADASRRYESAMADMGRERDAAVAEAEKKHGKLQDAALAKLRKTIEKETERALADQRIQIGSDHAAQYEVHAAELQTTKARITDLEQGIARAQADRDAERILRLDVERSAAKRMRDMRGRTSTPPSIPEEPTKAEPPYRGTQPQAPLPSVPRTEPDPVSVTAMPRVAQEEPSPAPPPTLSPTVVPPELFAARRSLAESTRRRVLTLTGFAAGGAAMVFLVFYAIGIGPFAPPPIDPPLAAAQPTEKPAPRMFGAPPVVCQAALTLDNVPKGSETLRRLGVAPLSATMPMHVPLEIVAMREGSAPRRALVEASASWKTDDIVPRLELRIPLDAGTGAWPSRTAPLPMASPTEPPRGMLQLSTDPTGAALWLTVDPTRIANIPCGVPVDLMVVAPGAAPKSVRVEWNAFTGAPPRATHKL